MELCDDQGNKEHAYGQQINLGLWKLPSNNYNNNLFV